MLRPSGFSRGEGMSNTTLLLEASALIKDAYDRLGKVDPDMSDAGDAILVAGVRLLLATAHKQLRGTLHDRAGR